MIKNFHSLYDTFAILRLLIGFHFSFRTQLNEISVFSATTQTENHAEPHKSKWSNHFLTLVKFVIFLGLSNAMFSTVLRYYFDEHDIQIIEKKPKIF